MSKNFFLGSIVADIYNFGFDLLIFFGVVHHYLHFNRNLFLAILPFVVIYAVYTGGVVFSSMIVGRIGTRRALILAMFFFAFSTVPLFLYGLSGNNLFLIAWVAVFVLGKLLFNPAQITLEQKDTVHRLRGEAFSLRYILIISTAAVTPFFAALLLKNYGIIGLGVTAASAYLAALLPISRMQTKFFTVDFYKIAALAKKPQTGRLISNVILYSLQRIFYLFWPIYIFLLFDEKYLNFGLLFAAVAIGSTLILWLIGRKLDQLKRVNLLEKLVALESLSWLLKSLTMNPLAIIIFDILYRISRDTANEAYDTVTTDLITDHLSGDNEDEAMILKEWATHASNALGLILGTVIIVLFGFRGLFLTAAGVSLLFILNNRRYRH